MDKIDEAIIKGGKGGEWDFFQATCLLANLSHAKYVDCTGSPIYQLIAVGQIATTKCPPSENIVKGVTSRGLLR